MNDIDGIIDKWANEAVGDLGAKGWREVDSNCMMLILYAATKKDCRKRERKITKPFWWLLAVVAPGVLWFIISGVMGL